MTLKIASLVSVLFWVHGATIGMTDDEAYYWVLSKNASFLGAAFHPPMLYWLIKVFSPWAQPFLMRFIPALCLFGICYCVGKWFQDLAVKSVKRSLLTFLMFPGVLATAWMSVPDLPLLFGLVLSMWSGWRICFGRAERYTLLFCSVGISIALLSKISALIGVLSLTIAFWVWNRSDGKQRFIKIMMALFGAVLVGLMPTLLWNSQNEWGSILYQIHDRHEGKISLVRYFQFLVIQAVAVGPILWFFSKIWRRYKITIGLERNFVKYLFCWILPPALVFGVQPFFGSFKPHWALVIWLPFFMEWGLRAGKRTWNKMDHVQIVYAVAVALFVWVNCHIPLLKFDDPRWDVSNDLFGWNQLQNKIKNLGEEHRHLPVVGSRYQTASQAAFALGSTEHVTKIPVSRNEELEWPDLGLVKDRSNATSALLKPLLYVSDNRYSAAPIFAKSQCTVLSTIEHERRLFGFGAKMLAKKIDLWRCDPI